MHPIVLENEAVRLLFSADGGALIGLTDVRRGFEHVARPYALPFRLFSLPGRAPCEAFTDFRCEREPGELRFFWRTDAADVTATVRLLADGAAFRASARPRGGDASPQCLEYPLLGGLTSLNERTWLAHSWTTGVLMNDPASFLPAEGALRFAPYPECFSGASMQLMSYYHQGTAGLYLAAHDGEGRQKWLNAYAENGLLTLSHMAGMEDLRPGAPTLMPYDFVVRLTAGDGWEEAAEMYRAFALRQPWCARGTLAERMPEGDWLHNGVGYCTFGVDAGHDRGRWLRRYREDIGCPGFHVLGPDWTHEPQTFGSGIPGGMEDWLPTRFSPETLAAVRENGDRFAPFEFDFLVDLHQHDREKLTANLQRFPSPTFSHDAYQFNMLCPCEPFTKAFHRERDVQVLREANVDAMYYDISANNLIKVCAAQTHTHTPGGGREITEGYRDIYADTGDALSREAGRPIPLGTEQMCEVFLDRLDFYQARAWAQPCSTLETWPLRGQMLSGQARMIPLFDMVYHEYGVVRMDGWGKLTDAIGGLFFDTVAKTYLWGGLYEVNHEYSPMEELDGVENPPEEHYFRFDPQHCAYSGGRAAYVGRFAAARLGRANPYWVYGRMLPAPAIDAPVRKLAWYHYNHDQQNPSYRARGEYPCPAVRTSLFQSPDGRVALFMVCPGEEPLTVPLPLRALAERYDGRRAALHRFRGGDAPILTDFGMLARGRSVDRPFVLEPRELYMFEMNTKEDLLQ
jgi:hypothetical protein